jgi:hypothetical protein
VFQRASLMLSVMAFLAVAVVTHAQTAVAVREAIPCVVPSSAALDVGVTSAA